MAARLQEAVNEEEQNGDQSKEMPSEGNENVDNPTNKGNFWLSIVIVSAPSFNRGLSWG